MDKHKKSINYIQFIVNYHMILLIPMFIVSFSVFYLAKSQLHEKLMNEIRITTESQVDYWKQQLSVISIYNADCHYSKIYNELQDRQYPGSYLDITEDIKKKEAVFPLIERLYFYDNMEKKIFSSSGTIDEDLFFSSICKLEGGILNLAEKEGQAAGRATFYQESVKGAVLVYLLGNEDANGRERNQYLIYTIRDDKLIEQFSPRIQGAVTVITDQNTTIYSSTGKKLEELQEGMESYSVDIGSGFTIWNLIPEKEVWSIALPYLQGYAVWIFCSLIVGVILAVYYSRKRYAVFQDLVNHNVLLEGERNELRSENCLYNLLTEDVTEGGNLWQECLYSGIRVDRMYKYIAAFPKRDENEGLKACFFELSGNHPLTTAYRLRIIGDMYVYLVCTDETAEQVNERLMGYSELGTQFEVSEPVMDAGQIRTSYEAVMKKMRKTLVQSLGGDYPKMELDALKEASVYGDHNRMKVLLKELGGIAAESSEVTAVLIGFETAQMLELDVQGFYKLAKEGRFSKKEVLKIFDQALESWKAAERKSDSVEEQFRKKTIADVLAWLHEHYLDDNFTVKYMADYFDTSVSNLSHFFKKNMGITISQYVEKVKLEKARELLLRSDAKISEIAQVLRYGNSSAFIAMFKKYEGVTPKEYRDHHS